ncbi:MAG: 2-amino-4-hydroxy-6-hydroxymethyldihydropteridine diphosphokinase [Gammaproteobacteria bacterium]
MPDSGPVSAFIGLGSNLDDPRTQIERALQALSDLPETTCTAHSAMYRSAPMGPQDQPAYINAVARLETGLSAEALLDALQAIEARHGRVRGLRWGPRTLDLDILLYGSVVSDSPRLQVPHPGLVERNFVLYPLAEIAPDLVIPGLGPLQGWLAGCPPAGLERLREGDRT